LLQFVYAIYIVLYYNNTFAGYFICNWEYLDIQLW